MGSTTYYARKAAGVCAKCGGPRDSKRTLCAGCRAYHRDRYVPHPAVRDNLDKPARRRKQKYNLTPAQYEELQTSQDSRCAICGSPGGQRGLVVDHNHTTGKVRGLLCDKCNRGLGFLEDSKATLLRALAYLEDTDD